MTIYYRDMLPLHIYSRRSISKGKRLYYLIESIAITESFVYLSYYTKSKLSQEYKLSLTGKLESDGRLVCKVPTIEAGLAIFKILP